jgi:hypothetical protein
MLNQRIIPSGLGTSLVSEDGTVANTFAYPVDIKESAMHVLSSSIDAPSGSAVDKIKLLEAYYFYMNDLGKSFGWDRPDSWEAGTQPKRIGLMAQDLKAVEPSLVREMTWLDADDTYWWVDYDALYVLVLDAINELNTRAEAVKSQANILPAETYPASITTTAGPSYPTNYQLSVTPDIAAEGSVSTWTCTADNIPDGTVLGFKLFGNCNFKDITCSDEEVHLITLELSDLPSVEEQDTEYPNHNEYHDTEIDGWATGVFTFLNGSSSVVLNYVLDNEAEGDETIVMKLQSHLMLPANMTWCPVNAASVGAVVTDN